MESLRSAGDVKAGNDQKVPKPVTWGRAATAKWHHSAGACFMVAFSPLWMLVNWMALQHFGGSVTSTLRSVPSHDVYQFLLQRLPRPSLSALLGYTLWLMFQALLYSYLPGRKCFGQRTPGGHLLSYTSNGLVAWSITHLLFWTLSVLDVLDPAIIAKS